MTFAWRLDLSGLSGSHVDTVCGANAILFLISRTIHVNCMCLWGMTFGGKLLSQMKENCLSFNPLTTKLWNLNFHPLEVVSR